MIHKKIHLLLLISMMSLNFLSCRRALDNFRKTKAELTPISYVHNDFIALPKPKGKIIAAVYSFRDQTGQYKFHNNQTSSFSTLVSQGATSMLVKVLEDSGWFITMEREGLQDLLNERKILKTSLGTQLEVSIPPLIPASILFEGGVIAYETNFVTGGIGAKYLGVGGSSEIRQDQVTVMLRAVNVKDGQVLKNVSVTKKIFSKRIEAGVYKFVAFKKLLEAETGFTTNEPPQQCVYEAIEKAVMSIIIEGIFDGLWEPYDSLFYKNPIIQDYLKEKKSREGLTPSMLKFLIQSVE